MGDPVMDRDRSARIDLELRGHARRAMRALSWPAFTSAVVAVLVVAAVVAMAVCR